MPVTAQLVNQDTGLCWEGVYDAGDIIENTPSSSRRKRSRISSRCRSLPCRATSRDTLTAGSRGNTSRPSLSRSVSSRNRIAYGSRPRLSAITWRWRDTQRDQAHLRRERATSATLRVIRVIHAHIEGFDLHANVAVRAGETERLEHLCRYILRPPVAQGALELTPDGRVLLRLRRPWRDGTRAICFEPSEFLEKLAVVMRSPDKLEWVTEHALCDPCGALRMGHACARPHGCVEGTDRRLASTARTRPKNGCSGTRSGAAVRASATGQPGRGVRGGWSVGPLAAGVVLVIGSVAHAREPRGRARCRGLRQIDG